MKKLCKLGIFLTVLILTLGVSVAHAFNPGAHIYIADHVYPFNIYKTDLNYCSIAPDLALYADQTKWPVEKAYPETHREFINLMPYAWSPVQKACAKGWLTHNELWGADLYAHVYQGGYAYVKAEGLKDLVEDMKLPWNPEFGHDIIEATVDLLLKEHKDPLLGAKILEATLFRSWEDRNLMARVLVWKAGVTDWVTLASAELAFRNLVTQYAMALSLSNLTYKDPLIELGIQLAAQYDIILSPEQALTLLNKAIELCKSDYLVPIKSAINGIKSH